MVQAKLDRHDVSGSALAGEAFTIKDPEVGKRRLRFDNAGVFGGERWKSQHQGAMHFAMGCAMGIRNWAAHEPSEDVPEQEALEKLAALSVLARWIDAAVPMESDPAT